MTLFVEHLSFAPEHSRVFERETVLKIVKGEIHFEPVADPAAALKQFLPVVALLLSLRFPEHVPAAGTVGVACLIHAVH